MQDARRTARILGYAGLIPFYVTAFGVIVVGEAEAFILLLILQIAYGAVIASFLGGVSWGLAMDGSRPTASTLLRSVVPGMVGWGFVIVFALMIFEVWLPMILSRALFATFYVNDRHAVRAGLLPGWYGALRGPQTGFVILAFLISLAGMI